MNEKELVRAISIGVSAGLWRFFWSVVGVVVLLAVALVVLLGISA